MTDAVNWPALIGAAILTRRRIDEVDPDHLQEQTLPRVKASAEDIAAFEQAFGEPLPAGYREFLLAANGWPQFYFEADLFGLPELYGNGTWTIALETLQTYDEQGVLDDIDLDPADVLPIGAGPGMSTLYLVVRSGRPGEGQVSWLDGEEIDRYADMAEFLASITAYQQQRLEKLQQNGG